MKNATTRKRPPRKNEGRPTKYGPEVLEKIKDYLKNHKKYGDPVPTHSGLADELDISTVTLYEWAKDPKKAEFSNMLGRIKTRQERGLLAGGLEGDLNANITKLMLAKHGYHDKAEIENTGKPQFAGLTIIHGKDND
mgnify:CR=1 FL=1|jgi:hypothetical protein